MKDHKIEIFIGTVLFTLLLSVCIFIAGGMLLGGSEAPPQPEQVRVVTSEIILEKITTEAFLVTKTVFLDQEKTIRIDQGSDWSNFWWGQTIEAEAIIRVDVGVDYQKVGPEDIVVDNEAKTVTVNIPEAEILDSSLYGEINAVATNGILRQLFANDPNQDFNLALEELDADARLTVERDPDIFAEAEQDSIQLLELLLSGLGYTVDVQTQSAN
ncbi:MAG: hypothetical protein TR69_WS6001001538 [candidate division WS6 bacterium OLB20]|uniref:DUF4230 domain-containing protein n=1 Tax=candidate division WS6 bacterium OLB20 TaxID=1617426 RepID=A0A136LVS3_9BACT|nr:MAG: hypothetical protein TR69_WS6001001538 [candidate division WS6 bacterium OLB20]